MIAEGCEGDCAGRFANVRLHGHTQTLKGLVHLIAGLDSGTAGADEHAGNASQSDALRRIERGAGANHDHAAHHRHLVLLHKVQLHSIGQSGRDRAGGLNRVKRGILEVSRRKSGSCGRSFCRSSGSDGSGSGSSRCAASGGSARTASGLDQRLRRSRRGGAPAALRHRLHPLNGLAGLRKCGCRR